MLFISDQVPETFGHFTMTGHKFLMLPSMFSLYSAIFLNLALFSEEQGALHKNG